MGFRLKTSKKTKEIFEELSASCNLKPFALSKIAICMSINKPIGDYTNDDVNGLELQRSTITGENDAMFKALIEMNLGRHIRDDEYCPKYLKLHLDRGAELLHNSYKYAGGSLQKFLKYVLKESEE